MHPELGPGNPMVTKGQVITMFWRQLAQVVLVTTIVYLLFLLVTKFMGRKTISGMTVFDFIAGVSMGSLGGGFITHYFQGAPVTIAALPVLGLLVVLTGEASLVSLKIRRILIGEPMVVIKNGQILEDTMKKARYNLDNLVSNLRQNNVFDLGMVEFAVLEPDGRISVQKKSQREPLTPADLGLPTIYKGIACPVVREGKVVDKNLALNGLDAGWLRRQLAARGGGDVTDIFFAALNTDGTLYVDWKKDGFDDEHRFL